MDIAPERFRIQAKAALTDPTLQEALSRAKSGFMDKRRLAVEGFGDFEALRAQGRRIRDRALEELDVHLQRLEAQVTAAGGQVHWAESAAEARQIIVGLCREAQARRITKSKSMVGEEIALNPALEQAGFDVVETDLGEYIIQLAEESPSHIIAPAVHKTRRQISALFDRHHHGGATQERLREIPELVQEAREVLRDKFLTADVGITGANFLVAETGSIVLVTNEGNADLTHTLPRVHIAVAGIDKIVPTLDELGVLLRLLGRSATGQEMSCYTTLVTGARRADDPDGPEAFHLVLLDNGRSRMLAGPYRAMLRCIRCGACMNHCPVYSAIGGHAYGWVYPGPMGSVLTPLFVGLDKTRDLPQACTLNGRCASVCPVQIPLPELLRQLRSDQFRSGLIDRRSRLGLRLWGYAARRPGLYRWAARAAGTLLRLLAGRQRRLRRLPLAQGWAAVRDLPAPQEAAWQRQYRRRQRRGGH